MSVDGAKAHATKQVHGFGPITAVRGNNSSLHQFSRHSLTIGKYDRGLPSARESVRTIQGSDEETV